ncbi:MAG: hypothetical protein AAGI30_01565 [Planctomycetota bacterium]
MPSLPLKHATGIDDLADGGRIGRVLGGAEDLARRVPVAVVEPLQTRLFVERSLEVHLGVLGHQLGQLVDLRKRDIEHATDVADGGPRLERPERDDLGDVTVLLADVLDDPLPPVLAQVDIDIGVLGTIGVSEPLEEQAVPHRAGVGEAEQVPDHGADARTTGERGDAVLTGPVHEVPHNQEVGRDRLIRKDAQLAIEARTHIRHEGIVFAWHRRLACASERGCGLHRRDACTTGLRAVAPDETGFAELAERSVALGLQLVARALAARGVEGQQLVSRAEPLEPLRAALRAVPQLESGVGPHHIDDRRMIRELKLDVARLGDAHRVIAGLRTDLRPLTLEQLAHLLGALDVELWRVAHARRVGLELTGGDADQRVVRIVLIGLQEVSVVVAHEGQVQLVRETNQVRVDRSLLGDVVLQLHVKAAERASILERDGREHPVVPLSNLDRMRPVIRVVSAVVVLEVVGELGAQVAIDRNETLRVSLEQVTVDAGLVVEAGEVGLGGEDHEVLPPSGVHGEQHEVEAAIGDARLLAAVPRVGVGSDVGLAPEDGLDARSMAGVVEGHRPEQVAVVGDGHRIHAELFDPGDEPVDPVPPVEQRELGV